jgi:DNA-binding LytR/AlgR family response regulator
MESAKLGFEIYSFRNGEDLLASGKNFDILFLDIEMPKIDGFQAAEKMNEKNDELIIIFLTGYTERFQRAFKVNAFRYLIKPIALKEFNEALSDALDRFFSRRKIIVDDDGRNVFINDGKIIYIESIGDKSVIYTEKDGSLVSRKTLKHWLGVLEPVRFIQAHKSYIVSFEHIRSLDKTSAIMTNGAEIPISARSARQVRAGMDEYVKTMAKGRAYA